MTEFDDNLLKDFFNEHKQEIADNGFSARVIRHLPIHLGKLSAILVSCCTILSIILFLVLGGFQAVLGVLREVFVQTVQYGAIYVDLKTLLMAGAVLLIFGVHKIYTME